MPCITFLSNRKPFSFILLIRLDRTCTSLEIDQDSVKQSNAGREGPEKWRNDWWDGMSVEWGLFTQVYSATFFSKCLMYSEYSRLSLRCARYSLKYSGYSRYSRVFLEYVSSILLDIFRISFQTLSEYFSKPSFMYLHLQHLLKNNFTLFPEQKQKNVPRSFQANSGFWGQTAPLQQWKSTLYGKSENSTIWQAPDGFRCECWKCQKCESKKNRPGPKRNDDTLKVKVTVNVYAENIAKVDMH